MWVYDPYQVNDYIKMGADKIFIVKIILKRSSLDLMTPITWRGVILIMYTLLSLNWHVSVSQNNYTSNQGLWCSHGFMSLM